ncbi:MAG TPA: hypothetical protein ENN73_02500 [Firmicutes bacterium]|nr:hypothetical protein [Bacillota bacterium]
MTIELNQAFMFNKVTIKKKFLKVIGGEFRIYDENERLILFAEQEGLKIRGVFHVYPDENKTVEILGITTSQIIDFAASYTITDAMTKESIGAVKREGIRSIVMDEWTLMNSQGMPVGKLKEENVFGAVLSRMIKLIPQKYLITAEGEREVAKITRHFDPFILKYDMTITDINPVIDRRIIFGALILLAAIEGREK